MSSDLQIYYSGAMARMRANSSAVWSPKAADEVSSAFAAGRVHKRFADVDAPEGFKFSRNQSFFCVGSCFARELEDAIEAEGGRSETRERSLSLVSERPDLFARAPNVIGRPNAFLNRYNSPSMALLMEDIATDTLSDRLLLGREKRIDFHYTRFIQPLLLAEAIERRSLIREMYLKAARAADIFVFTLGLCEAFFDIDEQAYLNITPDPKTAAGRNLEFRFLDLAANLDALRSAIASLRSIQPNAEIVLTVSPVPLDVTFTSMDVVVANNLAKSTLVAAAHTICSEITGCHYFPSYEMVMNSTQADAWQWDKKHVAPEMVSHIMKSFMERHLTV